MSSLTYLLVSEGPTDILVIKEIANKISKDTSREIIIQELSPQRDATTNSYPNHGWKEVKRWCSVNGNNIEEVDSPFAVFAKHKHWRNHIAFADGLIIQIDTDIAEYIDDMIPSYSGDTKNTRKNFCKKALLKWLGEMHKPEEIYFLLSTHSTENWVLATHARTEAVFNDLSNTFDFEEITNVVDRLGSLGYTTYVDPSSGKTKLSKDLKLYSTYAKKIKNNLIKVRQECEEAERFYQMLSPN
jgi:hypothetical protein